MIAPQWHVYGASLFCRSSESRSRSLKFTALPVTATWFQDSRARKALEADEQREKATKIGVQEAASDRNRPRDISREANCKKFRADCAEATT